MTWFQPLIGLTTRGKESKLGLQWIICLLSNHTMKLCLLRWSPPQSPALWSTHFPKEDSQESSNIFDGIDANVLEASYHVSLRVAHTAWLILENKAARQLDESWILLKEMMSQVKEKKLMECIKPFFSCNYVKVPLFMLSSYRLTFWMKRDSYKIILVFWR